MTKYGFEAKKSEDIKRLVGKGANSLITRSVWGQAQENFRKIDDKILKKEMVDEFLNYYTKNICVDSKLINGVQNFLEWCRHNKISLGVCTNKQDYLSVDLLILVLAPLVGLPQGVTGCLPPDVLPSPPPCG